MQWKLKDNGVAERISDLSSEDKSKDKCTEVERGVVQVHKSSPSEIYGTIQDGRTGRSFRLVRTDGHNWKLSYNDKDNSTKKLAIVEKVKDKWLLYTKDKSRVLGTHDTAKEAYGQEYAIEKSQEKSASATEPAIALNGKNLESSSPINLNMNIYTKYYLTKYSDYDETLSQVNSIEASKKLFW